MKSLNKKAELESLHAIIMTLVVIGLLLGVGLLVLREFTDNLGDTAAAVTNESVASLSNTTWTFFEYNYTSVDCWNSFVAGAVYNNSGTLIGSANYTFDAWRGALMIVGDEYNGATLNLSYTYQWSASSACDAIESTIDAEEEVPVWLSIIVLLLVVGIILTLVFKVLPSFGGGTSGGFGGGSDSGMVAEI